MRLATKGIILVSIPVIAEIASVATLSNLLHRVEQQRAKATHCAELVANMTRLQMLATDRNVAILTNHLVGSKKDRDVVEELQAECRKTISKIDELVANYPEESAHWAVIKQLSGTVNDRLVEASLLHKSGKNELARMVMAQGQGAFIRASKHIKKLTLEEQESQSAILAVEREEYQKLEQALQLSVGWSVFIALALLVYFNKTTAERLALLMGNAKTISKGLIPNNKLDGKDELAELDQQYRDMAIALGTLRERERDILEQSAEGICSFDENLRISDFNKSIADMLGANDANLSGTDLAELISKEAADVLRVACKQAKEESSSARVEVEIKRNSGESSILSFSLRWSERSNLFNCIVRDVTERANLDRLKSEFVAMVSHDLRSPLTAIQLSQDFLRTEELSKDGRDALQESSDTIKRLLSLVNNLLDLDRLEAQNIQINPEERSLRDVCIAACSATKLLAEQAGIAVEVDAEPELKAYYDFERIMQVFFNLLSNAFKFSASGTKVSIKCFASDNQAIVEVKDEGKGIPVDQLEHVFERFKQVDPSTDNKVQKGSGLGLAICKAIVERHGGKISAISDAGNGTTIRFSLPLTGRQS